MLMGGTLRREPLVKIKINTPNYVCEVEAAHLPEALNDPLIGNIEVAPEPNDPDPSWGCKT